MLTIFSSLAGGFFKKNITGEYAIQRRAITVNIIGNPTALTKTPLNAGPLKREAVIKRLIGS